jgi:hypothetical protein
MAAWPCSHTCWSCSIGSFLRVTLFNDEESFWATEFDVIRRAVIAPQSWLCCYQELTSFVGPSSVNVFHFHIHIPQVYHFYFGVNSCLKIDQNSPVVGFEVESLDFL